MAGFDPPPPPAELAPPLPPSMAEAADAAIAQLMASGGIGAAGVLSAPISRPETSSRLEGLQTGGISEQPRRKKSRWDDEPAVMPGVGSLMDMGFNPHPGMMQLDALGSAAPPAKDPRSWVMKTISIPVNCKGRVIGRAGETIKKMRAETQAYIKVLFEEGMEMANINLKGTAAQVEHAEVLIFECLKAGRPQDWEVRTIEVPSHCIGETIGKSGCNLQVMSEGSGCKVKFVYATELDPNEDPGKQVCVIRGPPEKINLAEMLLNERVAEVQQQHIMKRLKTQQEQIKVQENRARHLQQAHASWKQPSPSPGEVGEQPPSWAQGCVPPRDWGKGAAEPRSWGTACEQPQSCAKGSEQPQSWAKGSEQPPGWAKGGEQPQSWGKGGEQPQAPSWGKGVEQPQSWGKPPGWEEPAWGGGPPGNPKGLKGGWGAGSQNWWDW